MVEIERYRAEHLAGIIRLCEAEGWPSLPEDHARAQRVLTAPGVTTVVALDGEAVVGFAQMLGDGEVQAFLASMAVDHAYRRQGVARRLVTEGLRLAAGDRVDLLSEDEAMPFYESFPHFRKPGFRLYPFHEERADSSAADPGD